MAAIPGGICWLFGTAAAVLDELDYRGVTQNPIPDAVTFGVVSLGSILLLLGLYNIRRIQAERGGPSGGPGYYITLVGLVLMVAPIWPVMVLGPALVAIGVTIYGAATLASNSTRSLGNWAHVSSIPLGTITGFASAAAGYDGGLGIVLSLALISAGFMSLGYDVAGHASAPIVQEATT